MEGGEEAENDALWQFRSFAPASMGTSRSFAMYQHALRNSRLPSLFSVSHILAKMSEFVPPCIGSISPWSL